MRATKGLERPSRKASKKLSEIDDEYKVVVVDQTRKGVKTSLGYGWFKQGERNTIEVSGGWETVKLLGAVAETGESRYFRCSSNFTSEVTIHLLQALQREFGEKLVVVLDNAPYFASKAVDEFAANSNIELCYLPRYSPHLNPVEECWRQFNLALKNRLFEDLNALRRAIPAALDSITSPNLYNYLFP